MNTINSLLNKRTILITGIVVFCLLLVIAVLLVLRKPATVPNQLGNNGNPAQRGGNGNFTTYQDFVRSGVSKVCAISADQSGVVVQGQLFATNGKVRSDYILTSGAQAVQTHLIVDSGTAYMWTNDADKKGISFAVKEKTINGQLFQSTDGVTFNCADWKPSAAQLAVAFDLPTDITFIPLNTNTIKPLIEQQIQCGVCASLNDPSAKNSCAQQFVCTQL